MLVSSDDSYVVFDVSKQKAVETIVSHSQAKKKGTVIPTIIDISHDDKFAIEGFKQNIYLRNL
jgi:hypothetical protein